MSDLIGMALMIAGGTQKSSRSRPENAPNRQWHCRNLFAARQPISQKKRRLRLRRGGK